jgi:hypothetical protein
MNFSELKVIMIDTKDVFIINMLYLSSINIHSSFGIILDPESMSNFQYKKTSNFILLTISLSVSISPRNPLVWANPVIPGFINVSS